MKFNKKELMPEGLSWLGRLRQRIWPWSHYRKNMRNYKFVIKHMRKACKKTLGDETEEEKEQISKRMAEAYAASIDKMKEAQRSTKMWVQLLMPSQTLWYTMRPGETILDVADRFRDACEEFKSKCDKYLEGHEND